MKRLIAVCVVLVLLLGLSNGALASKGDSGAPVVKKLQPEADSVTLPGELIATEVAGETTISMHGQHKFGTTAYYRIQVDVKKGTYKASHRDIPSNWGVKKKDKPKKADGEDLSALGTYSAEIILITEDLPQLDLATTTNYMSWNVVGTSVVRDSASSYYSCVPSSTPLAGI